MISDVEYQQWLRSASARRVLLVELSHSAGTEYVSNRPYISRPGDSLPNQPFDDLLAGVFDVTSRIDSALSLGDIELVDDGSLGAWRDYLWRGYPVVMRLGDAAWSYDDFRVIASQVNGGLRSISRGRLVMGIYDAAAALEVPLTTGRPEINGQPVPLVLGQVFGAQATRIDSQALNYRCSWLSVASLVVRDGNGPVMSHTADYANGGFALSAYTPRTVLCGVQEQHDTAQSIVEWVAGQYGLSLAAMSLPGYRLGLRYEGEVTGRQILDDVCAAIGGHWSVNLAGQLQVQVMTLPVSADFTLTADDIVRDQIRLIRADEPWKSLELKYSRNHSPLSEVAGSINDSDPGLADRLREEWLSESVSQVLSGYPLAPDESRESVLVNAADAQSEAARRMAMRSERREVWELEVFMVWVGDIVGQSVSVDHPSLSGRIGRVISARMAPTRDRVTLEVWY